MLHQGTLSIDPLPAPYPLALACWQGFYELVGRINSEGYLTHHLVKDSHFNPSSLTCPLELTQVTLVTNSPELLYHVSISSPDVVSAFHATQRFFPTQAPGSPPVSFVNIAFKKTPLCLTLFSVLHRSGSGSCS